MARGQELKRLVRGFAAFQGIFDDTALGRAVGRTGIAVGRWWQGVQPEPDALARLAILTGLNEAQLYRYVYSGGPLPDTAAVAVPAVLEGLRRDRQSQERGDAGTRAPSPVRRPRGNEAGRG